MVTLIANILEPTEGTVLDPACGSGGMFVQSAHFVQRQNKNPQMLTFMGLEKNETTIRLAKMNLAVHGLEGNIQQAITYYQDPLELVGKADYVMANPPFNVDEVDVGKIENDPRLPLGLPGVSGKGDTISNGNYLWISYFYSYLNKKGRAGFVMSSQASSAGRDEAKVRQKLIETGAVEIMVAIRSNFFYTRSVPCELWFLNKAKPKSMQDKVLMIDARNIYRKVTRKIYDFSPEQLQNILAIVWLYRGESERFTDLVNSYLKRLEVEYEGCETPLQEYSECVGKLNNILEKFFKKTAKKDEVWLEFQQVYLVLPSDIASYTIGPDFSKKKGKIAQLNQAVEDLAELSESSRDLIKQVDLVYKLVCRVIDHGEKDLGGKDSDLWLNRDLNNLRKEADITRQAVVNQLNLVRYFYRQAHWLLERFPNGKLEDVAGLVKLVSHTELEANDWSLTPGRYVGVAPEIEDDDFDFEEALRDIHIELSDLNQEAVSLAADIARNFQELGI